MSDVPNDTTVTGYLFKRFHQAGLHAVHGVPGNQNIALLREATGTGLEWVSHHSDLSAGLAANEYARINRIAALITSFENLPSRISMAIAASYQDRIPVVLVIVIPQCRTQSQASELYGSFFDTDGFQVLADCFDKITTTQEFLVFPSEATTHIDTAIRGCIMQSRPVCIKLPEYLVNSVVPAKGLVRSLDFSTPLNDTEMARRAVTSIMNWIKCAEQPLILVDAGVSSCGLIQEANQIAKKTKFRTVATQFSRGVVDESLESFYGDVSEFDRYGLYFKSCDLILRIGPLNTTEWADLAAFEAKTAVTVTFDRSSVIIGEQKYEIFSRPGLQQILNCIEETKLRDTTTYPDLPNFHNIIEMVPSQEETAPLQYDNYSTFWRRMSVFFRPRDIILTETKTAQDGARSFVLPQNTTLINSSARGLPGHMLAVAMGVTLAQQSLAKTHYQLSHTRAVLFEGAREFQKAQNNLRAIMDKKLNLIIFVINEGEPVVEILMHAMEYHQQDSDPWRYSESVSFFGTPKETSYPVSTAIARTWGDFYIIVHDKMIRSERGLYVVEFMIKPEYPDKSPCLLPEIYGPPPSPFSLKRHHVKQD